MHCCIVLTLYYVSKVLRRGALIRPCSEHKGGVRNNCLREHHVTKTTNGPVMVAAQYNPFVETCRINSAMPMAKNFAKRKEYAIR